MCTKKQIVIEVKGGSAVVTSCDPDVEVMIVNLDAGKVDCVNQEKKKVIGTAFVIDGTSHTIDAIVASNESKSGYVATCSSCDLSADLLELLGLVFNEEYMISPEDAPFTPFSARLEGIKLDSRTMEPLFAFIDGDDDVWVCDVNEIRHEYSDEPLI